MSPAGPIYPVDPTVGTSLKMITVAWGGWGLRRLAQIISKAAFLISPCSPELLVSQPYISLSVSLI